MLVWHETIRIADFDHITIRRYANNVLRDQKIKYKKYGNIR